ncbi:hypothetical protein B9Z55_002086 [Caenorhabditis nigoni]|uniref:Methyltransferase domain-containing protein n=1 Tax=Caenorhabditis nigoni TaxID=1611254 RepID=A0A2G5VIR6_9PELO|nr:hypothetical protein B9Z55_002086 [Caenorhabditis nigoni]
MNVAEFCQLITKYKNILDSKSVEFYARRSWDNVDLEWQEFLEEQPVHHLITFANLEGVDFEKIPESLLDLRTQLRRFEYTRKCVRDPLQLWETWTDAIRSTNLQANFPVITSSTGLLRKKMKAKKQHEIDRIIELISQMQLFANGIVDSLIDIGAGVGHLSRMVSIHNKLAVMAVEGNHQFTISANGLDEKLVKASAVSQSTMSFHERPIRYTDFVTEEMALKVDDFTSNSAILVGLHCCGDFSSTVLKVFLNSQKARFLVLLGCCYHKEFQCFNFFEPDDTQEVSTKSKSTVFPLSRKWEGCELSYSSREAACHNNENMDKRFCENTDISRYARARLENWIWEISDSPEDRNIGMCSVKCVENETTFDEYIQKAMAKRGSHLLDDVLKVIPKSELSAYVSSFKCSKFDSYDVLRLMFAPAIESAILDDRIAFLQENGIHAECVPLFEPTISSRNLAIVAYK